MRSIPGYKFGGDPTLRLSSYLGGEYLGRVPVVSGSWEVTDEADVKVPGALKVSVPATIPATLAADYGDRRSWAPVGFDHPLSRWGQHLLVQVDVAGELVTLGWYRIASTKVGDPVVQVEARGLLTNIERARFPFPVTYTSRTRMQMVADLCAGIMPSAFLLADSDALDRTWERERIDALWDVIKSWPARAYVDDSGTLVVADPWTDADPAVGALTDGDGGGLLSIGGQPVDRDPFNAYVVSAEPEGADAPVVDWWEMPTGAGRWAGPYGQNPGFYASPLLPTDRDVLRRVAEDMTYREFRQAASVEFEHVFDPRLEVGDVVTVHSARQEIDGVGRILSLAHTRTRTRGLVALR